MSILSDESRPLLDLGTRSRSASIAGYEGYESFEDEKEKQVASYRLLAVTWVALATIIRFVTVARLPLGNGEAYYATWSRFLDWSYYDHPPLLAWMVRLTTSFGVSPATIRLVPVLSAGAAGLLFYRLAERFFGPRAALLALIILTAIPVFLVSSFVLNPEAPLAPLWIGYLLTLEGMRERDDDYRPLLAGALLGFAFLAKYTAILLVPTTFLYLAFSAPSRRWLRRPSLYLGGLLALVISLPVLYWNVKHGWPTLRLHLVERTSVGLPVAGENTINHLVEDASSEEVGGLHSLLRVLTGQFLSYSPLLAPALVMGLVGTLRRARRDDRDLFLSAFSWPVLLVMLAAMMRLRDAEQHWTMVAFIPAAIAAGRYADEAWSSARRFSILTASGIVVSFVAFGLGAVHMSTNAILRLIPASHYDPRADMSNELAGWDQVRASVAQVSRAAASKGEKVVLASNHYSMCGRLFMETGASPEVYCPTARRSAFDFFGRHDAPAGATVVALTNDIHSELPPGLEGRTCVMSDQVTIERAGRQVAHYFVQTCPPAAVESEKRASRD
jgi:hypothetical protein